MRTVIHEVALPSLHERMRIIPCSFASQETRADTNLDGFNPDSSAASSRLRAAERFDTISCVSKIYCGASRSKGIGRQTLGHQQDEILSLTYVERILLDKNATFNCWHCNFYHDILDIPNGALGLVHLYI